jgi:hypothetical protein
MTFKMIGIWILWLGGFTAAWAETCPAKISIVFCPVYASGNDTSLLKARIVLDRSLWVPSKTGASNPLVAGARGLVGRYPLRDIGDEGSRYLPRYLEGNAYGIEDVVYNNVLATKRTLDSLRDEPLVQEIRAGCAYTLAYVPMCDSFNAWPQPGWMKVFFYFKSELEGDRDAASRVAYFARYDLRDPENTDAKLSPDSLALIWKPGLAVARKDFGRMVEDPEVRLLEPWHKDGPARLSAPAREIRSGNALGNDKASAGYRADGRKGPPPAHAGSRIRFHTPPPP